MSKKNILQLSAAVFIAAILITLLLLMLAKDTSTSSTKAVPVESLTTYSYQHHTINIPDDWSELAGDKRALYFAPGQVPNVSVVLYDAEYAQSNGTLASASFVPEYKEAYQQDGYFYEYTEGVTDGFSVAYVTIRQDNEIILAASLLTDLDRWSVDAEIARTVLKSITIN